MPILASSNINELSLYPIYRHGSSFIRNLIQKKFLFDLEKKKTFGFALDWNCIFKMYHNGAKFKKINVYIQRYDTEGTSAQKYKSKNVVCVGKVTDHPRGRHFELRTGRD